MLADRLEGGMPREGILFVSFDDDRLGDLTAGDLNLLLEEYDRLHPEWRSGRRALFLWDEIQVVGGWERLARRILDSEEVELVVSGSSARMLSRDVIERHGISHPSALRQMIRQLLAHPGGPFSIHRFHNYLKSQGERIGKDSLHAYLGHLEDAFLVYGLWIATDSERRRMSNPRKVYPIDPGLIPIFDRSGRMQPSKALETAVCIDLLRPGAELSYVRTRQDFAVDYLARWPGGRLELIQVCAQAEEATTVEREVRALQAAAEEHPGAALTLLTLVPELVRNVPPAIAVFDASRWLLRPEAGEPGQSTTRTAKGR